MMTESKSAMTVARSLSVDNDNPDGLTVETSCENEMVISRISTGSINTLISTLDDLIRCQITSEALI